MFQNTIELIAALSKLLWSVLPLIFIWIFRNEIAKLLTRVKKGKIFGQEFELEPLVNNFQGVVKEAKLETSKKVIDVENIEENIEENIVENIEENIVEKDQILDTDIKEVLKFAEINPEIGIMLLSSLFEKDIRIIANSLGDFSTNRKVSARKHLQLLVEKNRLPKHTSESLNIFWDLRNRIVHGHGKQDKHNVLRVLDIGLNLLKTIRSIPHDIYKVYHPEVDIFEDEECTKKREGVKGLIVEGEGAGGGNYKCIFPSTKTSYYKKGKRVTWEWDPSKVWDETWYIDPDTNEKKSAWGSAAEFIGRHVEDL